MSVCADELIDGSLQEDGNIEEVWCTNLDLEYEKEEEEDESLPGGYGMTRPDGNLVLKVKSFLEEGE